jgi:hypothetical protein
VLSGVIERVRVTAARAVGRMADVARAATRPVPVVVGLLRDATRSREELVAENMLLRQQLIVAARARASVPGSRRTSVACWSFWRGSSLAGETRCSS